MCISQAMALLFNDTGLFILVDGSLRKNGHFAAAAVMTNSAGEPAWHREAMCCHVSCATSQRLNKLFC